MLPDNIDYIAYYSNRVNIICAYYQNAHSRAHNSKDDPLVGKEIEVSTVYNMNGIAEWMPLSMDHSDRHNMKVSVTFEYRTPPNIKRDCRVLER